MATSDDDTSPSETTKLIPGGTQAPRCTTRSSCDIQLSESGDHSPAPAAPPPAEATSCCGFVCTLTTLKGWIKKTGCHGLGQVDDTPNIGLKLLWVLVFLGGVGVTIYQIYQLVDDFTAHPVTTSFKLEFQPVDMPDVTICSTGVFNVSRVKTAERKIGCDLQALVLTDSWKKYRSLECQNATYTLNPNLTGLCDRYFWFCNDTQLSKMDKYIATQKLSLFESLQEDSEDVASYFTKFWTMEYGNCYTLNTSDMRVFESGVQSGLDIEFYLGNLDMDEPMPLDMISDGMRVVIHERGTRPLPGSNGYSVSAGTQTIFGIQPQKVSLPKDMPSRPCGNEKVHTGYRTYSVKPILEEEVCRRSARNVTSCKMALESRSIEDRMSVFLRIRLYIVDLVIQHTVVRPKYDVWAFLADLGGTFDFWIGVSLAGIAELIQFGINWWVSRLKCCRGTVCGFN
ncbi:hypothetical protein BaRGS_00031428 [Batillaria attramentaria]|uniref:Uncharacterized protein n=1 Tax=Batillaria attramentaria TaxID=370345 RepID=A0ABD0JR73_9CAEN